jgi:hypothetical protein
MGRKSAKVNSIDRIVDADLNISDFEHRPSEIRQWFSNNIIRPMFGYNIGWTGTKAVMLRATTTGFLKIASVGAGLDRVETGDGIAGAVESADIVFANAVSKVRVIANTNDMYFRPSRDGVNFEDQIHIIAGTPEVFDITCLHYRVQRYGVNDVVYEVEGYR